jgi:hypothetical protein
MTNLEIEKRLKESLMSDSFIEKVLFLHRTYNGSLNEMILSVRMNMKLFIDCGYSVIESYEILKEQRVIRCSDDDSLTGFERNLFKIIIECFTDWSDEIIPYEFLKDIKVVNVSSIKNQKRRKKFGYKNV